MISRNFVYSNFGPYLQFVQSSYIRKFKFGQTQTLSRPSVSLLQNFSSRNATQAKFRVTIIDLHSFFPLIRASQWLYRCLLVYYVRNLNLKWYQRIICQWIISEVWAPAAEFPQICSYQYSDTTIP